MDSCAAAGGPVWDPQAIIARVAASEAERRPVIEAIAVQTPRASRGRRMGP